MFLLPRPPGPRPSPPLPHTREAAGQDGRAGPELVGRTLWHRECGVSCSRLVASEGVVSHQDDTVTRHPATIYRPLSGTGAMPRQSVIMDLGVKGLVCNWSGLRGWFFRDVSFVSFSHVTDAQQTPPYESIC